jgi:peptidoglycan/LPS O-acetylase OafA/YrhL
MPAAKAMDPTASASAPRSKRQHGSLDIPSIDGLRAVSFMIVFLAHSGFDRLSPGGFGVTVFFLSGYLITTLMRIEAEKTGRVDFKAFYLRRALRILPPFYIALLVATILQIAGTLLGRFHTWPAVAQALHFSCCADGAG